MLVGFFDSLRIQMSLVQWTDLVDITIIGVLIYSSLKYIRNSRTQQLIKGVIMFVAITELSRWMNLYTLHYLMSAARELGMIAVIVVFHPEIRSALEKIGRTPFGKWIGIGKKVDYKEINAMVAEIKDSCISMSKERVGALIVLEKESNLGEYIKDGITLNAQISSQLLCNIFVPNSPLHDGAVVIRKNRIEAAVCFLPLTHNPDINKAYGTRHRAGIGISEETDAVVVIVSEETGGISIASGGKLYAKLSPESLENKLKEIFEVDKPVDNIKTKLFDRKEKN